MSNMNIAQVVCVFPPYKSGMGNVARQFAATAARGGHGSCVFTPDYGSAGGGKENSNFTVRRLKPLLSYGHGAFLPRLACALKDFDAVHLHYPFFGGAEPVWLAKVFLKRRFRLIIHYHMDTAGLSLAAKLLSMPSRMILGSLFGSAEAVTCASIDYVSHGLLKGIYEANRGKFREIPFAVDTSGFSPAPETGGNDARPARILFVGGLDRAHYFKGVDVLLKAAAALKTKNWILTIAGDGDLRGEYEKLARDLGVSGPVKFYGRPTDDELKDLYRRSDFLVLPSTNGHEAFGIVLLEAMASGLPVVASRLPGVRTVFTDGREGFLAKPGDAADLAVKLGLLLGSAEKRKEMGKAARKLAETKYAMKIFEEKLLSVYPVK